MGGIDQQITDRITRANGDPQALMGEYGNTKSILDLIAAQRAADLVKEQKRQLALEMDNNPATVADQLEKELVDGQKAEMRGPLEGLKNLRGGQNQGDKTRGVAGVLANQQRQQQQMQGRGPQPTMNVAHGGIINAPAPNLNRMYNGGIVGYAEGGLTRDEIAAYLKEVGVTEADFEAATSEEQERVVAGINKKIAEDRREGTRRSSPGVGPFGGGRSPSASEDVTGQATESFYDLFRSDPTGKELMKGRERRDPNEAQKAAEGRRDLVDVTLEDILAPIKAQEKSDQQIDGLAAALGEKAIGTSTTVAPSTVADTGAGADTGVPKVVEPITNDALEQLKNRGKEDFDPFAGAGAGAGAGIAGIKPSGTVPSRGPVPQQSPLMTPLEQERLAELKAEATKDIKDTPEGLTGSAAIQAKLDAMGGKKGIAGLVERFANTSFTPTYGGTYEALAQGGRDIAKTGRDEETRKRKFLEGQLATQQSIEAAQVIAEAKESEFGRAHALSEKAEVRLRDTMTSQQRVDFARLALDTHKERGDSLAKLAKLNLDTVNSQGAQDYRVASLALQKQANTFANDRNINAMHNVVRGYVTAATSFYKGLLANATGAEAKAIQYELKAEIARIVGMVGNDDKIDLSTLRKLGAAPAVTDATASNVDAAVAAGI